MEPYQKSLTANPLSNVLWKVFCWLICMYQMSFALASFALKSLPASVATYNALYWHVPIIVILLSFIPSSTRQKVQKKME